MKLPTLYKQKDKLQQWTVWTEGNIIYTEYGDVGGKLQVIPEEILTGKNIGKKNETTKEQQAEKEALSKWNNKKDRSGYSEEITESTSVYPMLAQNFDDHSEKILYPCYGQPKLDGVRAVFNCAKNNFFSRKNVLFTSVPYLTETVDRLNLPFSLDGEFYNHTRYKKNFEELTGFLRRKEPLFYEECEIEYHIFDVITEGTYEERLLTIKGVQERVGYLGLGKYLKFVPSYELYDKRDVEEYHNLFTSEDYDYEGLILRNKKGLYEQDKRSFDLQKYKKFIDDEAEIIGVEESTGKHKGCAIFVLKNDKGIFNANLKSSLEYRQELYKNESLWRGKKATYKYQNVTKYGIPRFPSMTGFAVTAIRDYE